MSPDTTERFESILAAQVHEAPPAQTEETLHDLALDQVFARIDEGAPRATSAFRVLLSTVAEVEYRQDVFRGLEQRDLRTAVEHFLHGMAHCDQLDRAASSSHAPYEAELRHLSAVRDYIDAVTDFDEALTAVLPHLGVDSEGWKRLGRHVAEYRSSIRFCAIEAEVIALRSQIAGLRYNALFRGGKVTVAQTDGEADLGESVRSTFERFRQGEVRDHRTAFRPPELDHVQAWMLERAALVHPGPFARLMRCARDTRDYRDPRLARFADEVRFYLAYLAYLAPMRQADLPISYPTVSSAGKTTSVQDTWDLALAARMVRADKSVVTNDVSLADTERILVISGPNQGGKTTLARMFGQLHHLAAIGCPIPGRDARIFLCDRVLTVFEREEQLDTLEGRLGAEVQRLYEMFGGATEKSVIVINEAFASTALHDARILTRDVLGRISDLDALAACVTFIEELSRLNSRTVSMVSTVDPDDPAVRTFRVERRVADGRAYARALATKHGLTHEQIRARMAPRRSTTTVRESEGETS